MNRGDSPFDVEWMAVCGALLAGGPVFAIVTLATILTLAGAVSGNLKRVCAPTCRVHEVALKASKRLSELPRRSSLPILLMIHAANLGSREFKSAASLI